MIVQTNLIPKGFDALTVWPFIFIRPQCVDNFPLIEHEKVHYEEQRASWVLPWLLRYWLSNSFRIEAEIRGYKRQIQLGGITVERAANMLMKYRTTLTKEQAMLKLQDTEHSMT